MIKVELSQRQRAILRGVVEEYVSSRQPVGSRTLVERTELEVSPSTVRNDLAELETLGLLTTRTPRRVGSRPSGATATTPTVCSSGSSRSRVASRST